MKLNQKGAGLIDTLIAFLILAIGIIALVKFQNSLVYSDDLSQQTSDAIILAIKQIETLRDTAQTQYSTLSSSSSTFTGVNTTYTITWTITAFTSPTYKTINVVVSWTDRFGNAQQIQQVTMVASLDPTASAAIM